jgi:transcriptional activator of cad operon
MADRLRPKIVETANTTTFRVGEWRVDAKSGQISRNGESVRVEVRTMRLLVCLVERAGQVVSAEELLNQVWPDVFVSQDSVYQAVAAIRRLLGDDPKQPKYIETVPRLGYRMVAEVSSWSEPVAAAYEKDKNRGKAARVSWAIVGSAVVLLGIAYVTRGKLRTGAAPHTSTAALANSPAEQSIAVLPFLDLTEGMKEEEFADGLTEELIDRLSKIPGFHVPPPTSSFYYKNKQVSVSEVASALGVKYVLDGSTRRSGERLRVAARLVRADNAYVLWSETYDRPWGDMLHIQDEIAGEVTKALKKSIGSSQVPAN